MDTTDNVMQGFRDFRTVIECVVDECIRDFGSAKELTCRVLNENSPCPTLLVEFRERTMLLYEHSPNRLEWIRRSHLH